MPITLASSGSSAAAQPGKQASATDLQSAGGLLCLNGGMILNPATIRGVDLMPVPNNSVVAADAGCGRVFYLTPAGSAWNLHAFDTVQGIDVGALPLPALSSAPQKLLRWGPMAWPRTTRIQRS